VGASGAADPEGVAGRATAQNRHAGGDELHSLFAAHWLPLALSAPRQRSAALDSLQFFREFQREGVWKAIWADLHMTSRQRNGREARASVAVLDSQSVKSAEKGAAKTTKWVTTPASS
jgi:transposase